MNKVLLLILSGLISTFGISPIQAQQSTITWLDDFNVYLPQNIIIQYSNCEKGYTFPDGYFAVPSGGKSWPDFPLLEGIQFESTCANSAFSSTPSPTDTFFEGITPVVYLIANECGDSLIHEFNVEIICNECEGQGKACSYCDSSIDEGCFSCDVNQLLNGYTSCTPAYNGPELQANQPQVLCNGSGVPNNMTWFSFVAGSTELCITIAPFSCALGSGPQGLQSGVYDKCHNKGGVCIGGETFCSSGLDPISYDLTELTTGNVYYLFVDGCNGAECDFEIIIEKGIPFHLDTPDSVVVSSISIPDTIDQFLSFGNSSVLQFDIHHSGDSPSNAGVYDPRGPYDSKLDAYYTWTFNPPINGMTAGRWNPVIDSFNIPTLTFEDVEDTTYYQICLTQIESQCEQLSCDTCCIDFIIYPQTTGLHIIEDTNMVLFPNPGHDVLYFSEIPFKNYYIQIFDSQLQKINETQNVSELNMDTYPPGIYYLLIGDMESARLINERWFKY